MPTLAELENRDEFIGRHIGPDTGTLPAMLATIGVDSVDTLIEQTVPAAIRFDAPLALPDAPEGEEILFDYASTGLTLRRHPMALLRQKLAAMRYLSSAQLQELPNGGLVWACGIVTLRQQPQTAKGVVFISLEDEHGTVQIIVWKKVREQQRTAVLKSRLLGVYGIWQREGEVRNLIAQRFVDLTPLLGRLAAPSRDFY